MKKIALFAVLMLAAAIVVPTTAFAAYHGHPTYETSFPISVSEGSPIYRESQGWQETNSGTLGYLTWSSNNTTTTFGAKQSTDMLHVMQQGSMISLDASGTYRVAEQELGPHSNYTINTVKCATCHSVHLAPESSWLLTQATGSASSSAEVCALCHNAFSGVSSARVSVGTAGISGNHGAVGCSSTTDEYACHAGVHGVGVSSYGTLAQKLLNGGADAYIDSALAANDRTGLTADYFDTASTTVSDVDKATFAVSYTCTMCHQGTAFATLEGKSMFVADPGNHKIINDTVFNTGDGYTKFADGTTSSDYFSSHPMLSTDATASTDWSKAGATFSGQIAFADAVGCVSCHSKFDENTGKAFFPHALTAGTAGDYNVTAGTASDPEGVWLEKASSATSGDKVEVGFTDPNYANNGNHFGSAADGVCLQCHRGDDTTGVGKSF